MTHPSCCRTSALSVLRRVGRLRRLDRALGGEFFVFAEDSSAVSSGLRAFFRSVFGSVFWSLIGRASPCLGR